MNDILMLKGPLMSKKRGPYVPLISIPENEYITSADISNIKDCLINVISFWEKIEYNIDPIVSVEYNTLIPKSNRAKHLIYNDKKANIVGAKFSNSNSHILTYCVPLELLKQNLHDIETSLTVINKKYGGKISSQTISDLNKKTTSFDDTIIARKIFLEILFDCYHIKSIYTELNKTKATNDMVATLYETGASLESLLEELEIKPLNCIENTFQFSEKEYNKLISIAPYLIAMSIKDLSRYSFPDTDTPSIADLSDVILPPPSSEPIIGVIDTPFDSNVYFKDWVTIDKTHNIDNIIGEPSIKDFEHGTKVDSIIVNGHILNPDLDDGCGFFRVKHFGIAREHISSFILIKKIQEIVESNLDIKVWNISLGSYDEIEENFMSIEGYTLDKLQNKYDIVFIVSGTNKPNNTNTHKIGAPADSINSIVVNSIERNGSLANYTRYGPVLSFYKKPDICYYGGTENDPLFACSPNNERVRVMGTSFAAPWIARKMSFLIEKMHLPREVAKALLIDSAVGWNEVPSLDNFSGFGTIPVNINDILQTQNSEIKFIISGISNSYSTYSYNIPVPINKDKHPFVSRATMCYYPNCSRNQGVDYTDTELDIQFGRINGSTIKTINNNRQENNSPSKELREANVRRDFRKWDNVKLVSEKTSNRSIPKKVYDTGLWGISLNKKSRFDISKDDNLRFGVVVTLKEINNVNRIEEFIQQATLRGWLVTKLNIESNINIYNQAEATIEFDE